MRFRLAAIHEAFGIWCCAMCIAFGPKHFRQAAMETLGWRYRKFAKEIDK